MFLQISKNRDKGVTLIEVLVAIFVVVTGITGSLALVVQTMAFTSLSSSRLVAAYLAQEGVEIVRNIRDQNWLSAGSVPCGNGCWNDGLDNGNHQAQYDSTGLDPFNIDDSLVLSGDLYIQGSGGKFQRKITITQGNDGDDYINVTVKVSWEQRGRHEIEVVEYLYNWL